MTDDHPQLISQQDMQRRFNGGPHLGTSAVMVLIGHRIYKRDGNVWRLLDNKVRSSVKEFANESA